MTQSPRRCGLSEKYIYCQRISQYLECGGEAKIEALRRKELLR